MKQEEEIPKRKRSVSNTRRRSRRRFLQAGVAGIASVAGLSHASAAESEHDEQPTSTETTEIEDWHDLDAVRDDLDGDYELVTDLDSDTDGYEEHVGNPEEGWEPIGDSDVEFAGTFDGNGHEIADLSIDRPDENHVGLFGVIASATIEAVSLTDISVTGDEAVGGLIGESIEGEVVASSATGTVTGGETVGGLVGSLSGFDTGGRAVESSAICDVTGEGYVGGLVGSTLGTVNKSYAGGSVSGENVGGLVGHVDFLHVDFVDGGIWNEGKVMNSYAYAVVNNNGAGGGLVGEVTHPASVLVSYWDTESTTQDDGVGESHEEQDVTGYETSKMQGTAAADNMGELDFEDTWEVVTDPDDYPILQWQDKEDETFDAAVETIDNTPVGDAEVRVYGRSDQSYGEDDRHSVSRYGRLIAETTTDENGHAELPTPKEDDDEVVVTARKGDWFRTGVFNAESIQTADDYGTIVLDRQLLCDPTVVWSDSGEPFGVVTVWRYLYDEETQIFYTEVTNTNKTSGDDLWEISRVSAGHGIEGGSFFFAFPDQSASVLADHESPFGMEDPTGDGGEHVFVTHPPQNADPTTAGIFHPSRDSGVGLPLYETTKTLGPYSNHEGPDPGWHLLTSESIEEAEELRGLGESAMMLVDLPLDKVGLPGLMDLLESLRGIADFLEDPETAEVNKTPDMPIADGQQPFKLNRAWEHDNPTPFDAREYEMSSVYQVPLQVDDEAQLAVTVRTEWSRDQGNFGIFSATLGTSDLDITSVELSESHGSSGSENFVQSDDERVLATTLRNRSTEAQTPEEVVLRAGNSEVSLTPNDPELSDQLPVEPGESISVEQSVDLGGTATSDVQPTVEVKAEDGTVSSRSYKRTGQITGKVMDAGDEPITNAEIEARDTHDGTTETTTLAGTDGDYTLALPAAEEHELIVTASGYESVETTISVEEDRTREKDFTLISDEENPSVADYTNENGVVETDGLRDAIDDWRAGDIETELLRDVIDAWRSGEPVE